MTTETVRLEQSEEVFLKGHKYTVTHLLDESGQRTGKGRVEVEDTIDHPDDTTETKLRRTGASYEKFLADVADDKSRLLDEKDRQEAFALLEAKRASDLALSLTETQAADAAAAQGILDKTPKRKPLAQPPVNGEGA